MKKAIIGRYLAGTQSICGSLMARSILESEVTLLLVLSNAMVGVHLGELYLHILITLNANPSDLLSTLPQLYTELKAPVGDPLSFGSPCLPAFLSSPYDKAIMQSLASTIKTTDQALLRKYLMLSLRKCGDVLESSNGCQC